MKIGWKMHITAYNRFQTLWKRLYIHLSCVWHVARLQPFPACEFGADDESPTGRDSGPRKNAADQQ